MIKENKGKFTKIINTAMNWTKKMGLNYIKNELTKIEELILKETSREIWYIHDKNTRWLWTPFGDIKFERTIWKNRETGNKKCLTDNHLGLVPFWYVQPVFYEMFIYNVSEIKSYKSLSKMFGNRFSSIKITRMIKRFEINLKPKKLTNNINKLYINMDGMWLNSHKSKKKNLSLQFVTQDQAMKQDLNYKTRSLYPLNLAFQVKG